MCSRFMAILALALTGSTLSAQETRLSGPTSGFVFDEATQSIRLIVGVPGASYLGPAIVKDLQAGSVSPDGRLAVALMGQELALLRLDQDRQVVRLDDLAGAVKAIAWSADSSAVAVWAARGVIYRNLSGPVEAEPLAALEADVLSLAVSSDGRSALVGTSGGVYLLDATQARLVAPIADAAGLALASEVLYAASASRKEVVAIRNYRESAEVSQVAGAGIGLDEPVALALAADGSTLWVADRKSRTLSAVRAASGELVETHALDFEPSRLEVTGSGLFLLNRRRAATEPLQVLDPRQRGVFFVPGQDLTATVPVEE